MGTTVFSPGLLPVIHGNTPGNQSYGIDVQLGTGGPLVLDLSTALIVLALFGALGFLVLVLSCTVLVLSLTVAAQSTHKDLSTRNSANAVTALFRCTNWIVLAVYAVCRHVYRLARVVYRASPLKHAVAIVQDVYFAALAVLNIVWHAGEVVIFALYLIGLVALKLALVILRFGQAAHALFAPLFSLFTTAYSISLEALRYMAFCTSPMRLCVYAYIWHAISFSGQLISSTMRVAVGLLSYVPALLTLVCLILTTVFYTLLALFVQFALFIATEQRALSSQAEQGEFTIVIFKAHHTPTFNNDVTALSIRPKLHVSKFHRLVRSYHQEESIMLESYQVDNVSDSLAIFVCSAWILTLLGNAPRQLEQSRAENTASGTGQQLCIRRQNVLAFTCVNVMDTTAYIEEMNDYNVFATDGAPKIEILRDQVPEVSVEYAMVPYGPSPPPLVQTLTSPAFFRELTGERTTLACRFVAYGLTKRPRTVPEQVNVTARTHRHLSVHVHLSLVAYCSVSRTWANHAVVTPRRLTAFEDDGKQLASSKDEDPDKTLCELVDPAIVLEEPEKTDGEASYVVDIPSQTLVSSRSLDEKVEQRIATITLADKVARNFKLDSLWDDYAKSGSASMALLSKAIVQALVASATFDTSPVDCSVSQVELEEQVKGNRKSPDAPSSCGTPQSALKATASTFVPVALRAAAATESISKSIPASAPSLKATAAPFVPSVSRQASGEAAEPCSFSKSASTKSVESKSCLKASAAAFVPFAIKVASTGPLTDSVSSTASSNKPASKCESTLKPTATPFVPTTVKSTAALPPLASTQLNAIAPQFVPLGTRCDQPDHEEGGSSVRMTQAQTTSKSTGRIPHGVRRARKRAKAALALAEAAAAAAEQ